MQANGGSKISETSEIIGMTLKSPVEEQVKKTFSGTYCQQTL
jgi:hypothetical protein